MTVPSDYGTMRVAKVEVSTDGTTWTDISGEFNSIDNSGGEIATGEVFVAGSNLPLVGIGKIALTESKIKVVYSETSTSAWNTFFTAYKNGSDLYLRYSPFGGEIGHMQFTSGKGFVTTPVYPKGEVNDPNPITCELTMKHPGFTDSIVAE